MKVAVIGAGVSGLTVAQELKNRYEVKVFEKESTPGGLIRCKRVNGSLYHSCGGHVFNSKNQDVLDWFWKHFDQEQEFHKADRNAVVFMKGGAEIPYPIENHIYLMDADIQKRFIDDLMSLAKEEGYEPTNFEQFLQHRFGKTLYEMYFRPYNEKVWRRDLMQVPLSWLEGKLPMPTVEDMIFNNINHVKEKQFVHSTFWYENKGGSQLIADRLAEGLHVVYNSNIQIIEKLGDKWLVCGDKFDKVVFAGNIKQLPSLLVGVNLTGYMNQIEALEYHGTTSVFCEIDTNPYSWIYQPSDAHESHRIICTGNFAESNNADGKMTGTIEFTDEVSKENILRNLKQIPLHPMYLDHHYNKYTYPIQDINTRDMIRSLKESLIHDGFYMTGRFADWEYYNMDVAIGAALETSRNI